MRHIGDEQTEKDVQSLDLGCQCRLFNHNAVKQFVSRFVRLSYFHYVDAVFRCRRDLYKLAADILTGTIKLVSLQWCYNKHLNTFSPHTESHQLHKKGFSRA